MMTEYTYIEVPFALVTRALVDVAVESSIEALRHTNRGVDLVILKFAGDAPVELSGFAGRGRSEQQSRVRGGDWS